MNFDIVMTDETIEIRNANAKTNLKYTKKNNVIVPTLLKGGIILGTHGMADGIYENANVIYTHTDGTKLEKLATVTVADGQIAF